MSTDSWVPVEYERSLEVCRRPLLSVSLKFGKGIEDKIVSLVDSGAQDTVFNVEIANRLGIPLQRDNAKEIAIGGQTLLAYRARVNLQVDDIGGFTRRIEVFFAEGLPYSGILGDRFFQFFQVCFERSNGQFRVRKNPGLEFQ